MEEGAANGAQVYTKETSQAYVAYEHSAVVLHLERPFALHVLRARACVTMLDLGCGSGPFSRFFRHAGVSRVVGVDASASQIDLARQEEAAHPLGIEYHVVPASGAGLFGSFDVVWISWVICMMKEKKEVLGLLQTARANLAPGLCALDLRA
jgi:2-polyprenyl-3-methyl-5-hydroxy-6-metoxy-1,4-benzoquinol methylase